MEHSIAEEKTPIYNEGLNIATRQQNRHTAGFSAESSPIAASSDSSSPYVDQTKPSFFVLTHAQGRSYSIDSFPFLIGREHKNDLQLETKGISRKHAEIVLELGRLVIRDLGSLNGTYVNGYRIDQVILEEHDDIKIGTELFKLHYVDQLPSELSDDHTVAKQETTYAFEHEFEQKRWVAWLFALVPLSTILIAAYLIFDVDFSVSDIPTEVEDERPSSSITAVPVVPATDQHVVYEEKTAGMSQPLLHESKQDESSLETVSVESSKPERHLNSDISSVSAPIKDESSRQSPEKSTAQVNQTSDNSDQSSMPRLAAQEIPQASSTKKKPIEQASPVVTVIDSEQQAMRQQALLNKQVLILIKRADQDFQEGRIDQWLVAVDELLAESALTRHSSAELKVARAEIEKRYTRFAQGREAFSQGDKVTAFEHWGDFLSSEKKAGREKQSWYYLYVIEKIGQEYLMRAQLASDRQEYQQAYRYWRIAAEHAGLTEAQQQIETINQQALASYENASALFFEGKTTEAQRIWKQVMAVLPSDHELYTKAASKLAWSYAYEP